MRNEKTNKILKLLALTDSTQDNEAISAFRMAKKIMAENNIRWRDLEDEAETAAKQQYEAHQQKTDYTRYQYKEPPKKPKPHTPPPKADFLSSEDAYTTLKFLLTVSFVATIFESDKIESLVQFYEQHGHLTDAQCRLAYVLIKKNSHHKK